MRIKIGVLWFLLAGLFLPLSFAQAKSGKHIIYEEKGNIFLKVDDQVAQITSTGRDDRPILSPDGKWVAFSREIAGKIVECSERNDLWACPSEQLWIINLETGSERLLLEPRTDLPPEKTKDIIYQFNGKKFSPDSKTIYFVTPAWATSDAIHTVNIDGSNERYVMHGYTFQVVREPLSAKRKNYLKNLKEDDWRIFPEKEGYNLVFKALKDDIIGYLIIERSGIRTISTPTLDDKGWEGEDGKFYLSFGREFWTELMSPDGKIKIPLDENIY